MDSGKEIKITMKKMFDLPSNQNNTSKSDNDTVLFFFFLVCQIETIKKMDNIKVSKSVQN